MDRATRSRRRSLLVALMLAAGPAAAAPKHLQPVPAATLAVMRANDVDPAAPILVRAFKREATMEVWKRARSGRYVLIKAFPVCRWSGQLGPKRGKGDRQTPEGFYAVSASQMNPSSSYHLAFDTGFPNAYDRANRATGSALMVHGTCSSSGCYAMTDKGIEEIYALAREAFAGGQRAFQFQSYPFHMTAENIVRFRLDPNVPFWVQLKEGSDRFEATGEEPQVEVAANRYVFRPFGERGKEVAAIERLNGQAVRIATLLAQGTQAVRVSYADGGQHAVFQAQAGLVQPKGDVSRPEALAVAGVETAIPGTGARQAFRMPAQWPLPPVAAPAAPPAMAATDLRSALALAGIAVPAVPGVPASAVPGTPEGAAVPVLASAEAGNPAPGPPVASPAADAGGAGTETGTPGVPKVPVAPVRRF
jgi:murein L,D-transpeptidase YafK